MTLFGPNLQNYKPDFTEFGDGDISGKNLVPGLYKWGTGLLIDETGVTLTGGVVSSVGKGVTSAAVGRLLKERGLEVAVQKLPCFIENNQPMPGTI